MLNVAMAITQQFKPIAEAILEHLENKEPNSVLFVVGKKKYKAKDIKKHILKEDKIANTIITLALKASGCQCQAERGILLSPDAVPEEHINATVQMFKNGG
jgi:hypothetical protein